MAWSLVLEGTRAMDHEYSIKLATKVTVTKRTTQHFRSGAKPGGNTTAARAGGYITRNWLPPPRRLGPGSHCEVNVYPKPMNCCWCRYRRCMLRQTLRQRRTKFCCAFYSKKWPLCVDCFSLFHTEKVDDLQRAAHSLQPTL